MSLLSVFFEGGPADTTGYFIAGYAIIFTVIAIYLISMFVRYRNLQKDYARLEGLED
jgi:CcmD family protein